MLRVIHITINLLFLCCLYITSIQATPTIDSLNQVLKTNSPNNNLPQHLSTYKELIIAYRKANQFTRAHEVADTALQLAKSINNNNDIAEITHLTGRIYLLERLFDEALTNFNKAITVSDEYINKDLKAEIHYFTSDAYLRVGQGENAYIHQLKAMKYWETEKDSANIIRSNYKMARIFFNQERWEEALKHYQVTLHLAEKLNKKRSIYNCIDAIGSVYGRKNDFEKALSYNLRALKLAEELNFKRGISHSAQNLAQIFLGDRQYDRALPYIERVSDLNKELNDKIAIKNIAFMLGKFYTGREEYVKAIKHIQKGLTVAKELKDKTYLRDGYQNLVEVYSEQSNWEQAYDNHVLYTTYRDSLLEASRVEAMAELEVQYETEKTEKELVTKENALLKQKDKLNNIYKYTFIGGAFCVLLLMSLLITFLHYRYKNQARINSLLEKKNQEIELRNREIELQNEKLATSNRDLEQFAYIASHDLKEPLRTIGGFTTLLQRRFQKQNDQDVQEYMGFIVHAVNQMHRLLSDLLNYSRIGRQSEGYETTDLDDILKQVRHMFRQNIDENNALIHPVSLPTIEAKRTQMLQLFQNLIGNALKFRREEPPQIWITYQETTDGHLFHIRDNGIGMEQQYLEKIFIAFQRLHHRQKYEGTGIGLATCKKILEDHGGYIRAESEVGKGSTFIFMIPKVLPKLKEQHEAIQEGEGKTLVSKKAVEA